MYEVIFVNPVEVPEACQNFRASSVKELKDRPPTAEVVVTVERDLKTMCPVLDAPIGLETAIEVELKISNSRRPAVLDITAVPTQR